jgi:hypothetical protein
MWCVRPLPFVSRRVHRDGQKKRVFVYRFLATGTIEGTYHIACARQRGGGGRLADCVRAIGEKTEKIYQRQITKQGLSSSVVDAKAETKTQFTLDDLRVRSSTSR